MTILKNGLKLALVAALFAGAPALAGDGCCDDAAKKTDAKADGCCGGETAKTPAEMAACLAKCDEKGAAALDATLAKLNGALPKLSAEDHKAFLEAHKTMASTCPVGQAFHANMPTILEAIDAIRALDAVMADGGKGLPADCLTKDGKCAFCAEAGGKMNDAAKQAMGVSMKSIARAEKLGKALGGLMASLDGDHNATTKPAGTPPAIPTKEAYAKLAERVELAAKALAEGFAKAKALPEADGKKMATASATIDKLAPAFHPAVMDGMKAFFGELQLAGGALHVLSTECPSKKDPKLVEGLSPAAKNAFALFTGRAQVIGALGNVAKAACMSSCGDKKAEGHGGCEKGEAKKEGVKQ